MLLKPSKSASGFQLKTDSHGLLLYLPEKEFEAAKRRQHSELSFIQFVTLRDLCEQGLADELPNGFAIGTQAAIQFDAEIRQSLALPMPWTGIFRAKAKSNTTDPAFDIRLTLHRSEADEPIPFELIGPMISIGESGRFLPDAAQWAVLSASQSFGQARDSHGAVSEVQSLRYVKALVDAKRSGARIDLAHFSSFDIVVPESVGIAVSQTEDGGGRLTPTFGAAASPDDIEDRLGNLKEKTEGAIRIGNRVIMLEKRVMRGVREVLKNRKIPEAALKTFIENPSAFIDASLVNLDTGFAARVRGATVFQLAYFGDTEKSESDWFGVATTRQCDFKPARDVVSALTTESELSAFETELEEALARSASVFQSEVFGSVEIDDVETARGEISVRRRELLNQPERTESGDPPDNDTSQSERDVESSSRVVVDIDTHDESLDICVEKIPASWQEAMDPEPVNVENLRFNPFSYQKEGIRWISGGSRHSPVQGPLLPAMKPESSRHICRVIRHACLCRP
ncbi:MAG: hypothetical protein AAF610_08680, partial [Pseudomonadota bacterium]